MIDLFLDTEFTTFEYACRQVISLGLVGMYVQPEYEFYVENTSHNPDFRTDWVDKNVMIYTDAEKYGKSYDQCCLDLARFIQDLPDERVNIIFDYVGDVELVRPMLEGFKWMNKHVTFELFKHALLRTLHERGVHMTSKIDDAFRVLFNEPEQGYFRTVDPRQHHALVDAKASRYAFRRALDEGLA